MRPTRLTFLSMEIEQHKTRILILGEKEEKYLINALFCFLNKREPTDLDFNKEEKKIEETNIIADMSYVRGMEGIEGCEERPSWRKTK